METLKLNDDLSVPLDNLITLNGNSAYSNLVFMQPILANSATFTVYAAAGEEVIRIMADGKLFWNRREVETDEEFRMAMMDLRDYFMGTYKPH